MYTAKRTVISEIRLTPLELARTFCDYGQDEQAEFFNYLEQITNDWDRPFCFQLQAIIDSRKITEGGRRVMRTIGEYGS